MCHILGIREAYPHQSAKDRKPNPLLKPHPVLKANAKSKQHLSLNEIQNRSNSRMEFRLCLPSCAERESKLSCAVREHHCILDLALSVHVQNRNLGKYNRVLFQWAFHRSPPSTCPYWFTWSQNRLLIQGPWESVGHDLPRAWVCTYFVHYMLCWYNVYWSHAFQCLRSLGIWRSAQGSISHSSALTWQNILLEQKLPFNWLSISSRWEVIWRWKWFLVTVSVSFDR